MLIPSSSRSQTRCLSTMDSPKKTIQLKNGLKKTPITVIPADTVGDGDNNDLENGEIFVTLTFFLFLLSCVRARAII